MAGVDYPILTGGSSESAEALVDRLTQQAIWKLRAEAGLEGGEGLGFIALIGAALSIVGGIVQQQQAKKAAEQAAKLAAAETARQRALLEAQQKAEDARLKNELEIMAARERGATAEAGRIPTWLPFAAAGVGVIALVGVVAMRSRK
jgi:Flp pilus assembly protein TadB